MAKVAPDALAPPGSVSARVVSESVLLLGGPRALLMQLAHPAVAAGVAEHSGFRADPFGRLLRTLDAMTVISFGAPEEAREVLGHLRRVHDGVRGELPDGAPYHANDPELLHWVHATLVDTVLVVERRYLGVLSDRDRHRYYEESKEMARAFGIGDDVLPPDLPAFERYVRAEAESLRVTDVARELSHAVLHPRVPLVPSPVWEPLRLVTVDLLPRPLREGYGLRWDAPRKRLLRSAQLAVRLVLPRVPRPIRNLPTSARRLRPGLAAAAAGR